MSTSKSEVSSNAIPRGWAMSTLAEATRLSRARGQPSEFGNADFVGLEHIEAQTTRLIGCAPAASMRSSGVTFRKGDVLYGRMRPYLNKVWVADRSGLCSGEFIVFGADGALGGPFLQYRLNAQDFVTFADHTTSGDRPRADFADLGRFPVLVPPASEQRRIEERIADLLADLNAGVAALERVKRNLVRYRAAVLHAAVTGQLTAAWRKRNGPPSEAGQQLLERILIERRRIWEERTLAKYRADGKQPPKGWRERYIEPAQAPSTSSANGPTPTGWGRARIEQLGFVSSGTTPKRGEPRFWQGGTVPWVSSSVVNEIYVDSASEFVTELALEETSLKLYEPGTLLVAMYGEGKTRGKVTELRISATCNQALAAISLVSDGSHVIRGFVKVCLLAMYEELRRQAAGGVQPNLNGELIARIEIPLPPAIEQREILALAQQRVSQIDALELQLIALVARAARLRQAILKAAFEGRLVPQDPSDEPAAVLLERIRAFVAQPAAKKPRKKSARKTATT
jgi:type I restriction enzyme S subunit